MTNWGIVAGRGVPVASAGDLGDVGCRLQRGDECVYDGVSRDELDDHIESIRALTAGLARHGRSLLAGQRIITGAFARFDTAQGEHWKASYSGIGDVEVRFT